MTWRRVPESNRSSRICNPSNHTEIKEEIGKRPLFVHGPESKAYEPSVNELDTSDAPENENPGALAGATGAETNASEDTSAAYRMRAERATTLCRAIAACEPEDATFILSGVLAELSAGAPPPALMGVMDEARTWADWASPIEIKAYALACFLRMPAKVQAEFLTWAGGQASGVSG